MSLAYIRTYFMGLVQLVNVNIAQMDSKVLHEFKRQASIFFREKIKVTRLALFDATPIQLLTEEIMDDASPLPDTRSMRLISRAAFDVDDYYRIVDILHKGLITYERRNWRAAYKAVILLEHLLTHGPLRIAEEFRGDEPIIRKMTKFQHVDEKGFNWGLTVRKKSERVLKLIEDEIFLKEERARTRKLTSGIKGFGSFYELTAPNDDTWIQLASKSTARCNSQFIDRNRGEHAATSLDSEYEGDTEEALWIQDKSRMIESEDVIPKQKGVVNNEDVYNKEEDHPFCGTEHQTMISLLS